jgi:hypothetical protein
MTPPAASGAAHARADDMMVDGAPARDDAAPLAGAHSDDGSAAEAMPAEQHAPRGSAAAAVRARRTRRMRPCAGAWRARRRQPQRQAGLLKPQRGAWCSATAARGSASRRDDAARHGRSCGRRRRLRPGTQARTRPATHRKRG